MACSICAAFVLSFGSEDFSRKFFAKTAGGRFFETLLAKIAINAASIGQVPIRQQKTGKILTVKIQYPENRRFSVSSDLKLVRPLCFGDYLI